MLTPSPYCQDEALHGRSQLLNSLGSLVLLPIMLGNLSLVESSAGPAVHLLRERMQVPIFFSVSLPFIQSSLFQAAQDPGYQQDKLPEEDD